MRKVLAILMLTVFGLPFATPLLASSRTSEAGLAACCRRGGAHHCMGNMAESAAPADAPQLSRPAGKCPLCPQANVPSHHEVAGRVVSAYVFATVVCHPRGSVQTESMWRIARDRSRLKRGPPTPFSPKTLIAA